MKKEEGITLVALIITVVVLLILAAITIQSGTESLDSTKLQGFYTQLSIVQKRVDDIAATNESYIDDEGNTFNLKDQGKGYDDLKDTQKANLQNILQIENLTAIPITNFRYFTIQELKDKLDLSEIDYNVFIDFTNRIVIAENGITANGEKYYVLENATYFVEQNTSKNTGTISLNYSNPPISYGTNTYKVIVTPSTVGDIDGTGYMKYKKTTTKYWETSNNTEIIVELGVEYNIEYIDLNNNSIQKTIKVELDSENNNQPTVIEITEE